MGMGLFNPIPPLSPGISPLRSSNSISSRPGIVSRLTMLTECDSFLLWCICCKACRDGVGVRGMGVAPAGTEQEDTGHHHILIDRPALGQGEDGDEESSDD